jgi:hypothetical protein
MLEEARDWLREHPGDDRVASAMQRLEESEERLRDPGGEFGWRTAAAAAVAGLLIGAAVYWISGNWVFSVSAALFVGVELCFLSWGIASGMLRTRRNRSG